MLNANFSSAVKDTDFKSDKDVPWDSPDMTIDFVSLLHWSWPTHSKLRTSHLAGMFPGTIYTWPLIFFENGRGHGHVTDDPQISGCFSSAVKDTDFKSDKDVPWDSPDMTFLRDMSGLSGAKEHARQIWSP